MSLSPDEQIHLTAAEGFIGLGMYLDADAALDDIDPLCRHLLEVLAIAGHSAVDRTPNSDGRQ